MPNPFMKEKKKCLLCQYNITPDYKNIRFLSQFQSKFTGIVYGRHITGLCKHKQEMLEREIKKAQNAGKFFQQYVFQNKNLFSSCYHTKKL